MSERSLLQGAESVRPFATNAWGHAGKLHVTARSKAVEIWKALQAKLQALLKNAKPISQKYLVKLQVNAIIGHHSAIIHLPDAATIKSNNSLLHHVHVMRMLTALFCMHV